MDNDNDNDNGNDNGNDMNNNNNNDIKTIDIKKKKKNTKPIVLKQSKRNTLTQAEIIEKLKDCETVEYKDIPYRTYIRYFKKLKDNEYKFSQGGIVVHKTDSYMILYAGIRWSVKNSNDYIFFITNRTKKKYENSSTIPKEEEEKKEYKVHLCD